MEIAQNNLGSQVNYGQGNVPFTGSFNPPIQPVSSIINTGAAREATINNQNYLNDLSKESAPGQLSPLTATSNNPQIQNTINTINEMVGKIKTSLSSTAQSSIDNINNISALEKQSQINAQNFASTNKYQDLQTEVQKLKDLRIQRDTEVANLYKEIQPLRQKYIEAMTPTTVEKDLGTQLGDIRKKQADYELSLEQGQQAQYGLGRPLALSTGRAQELIRLGQFTKQDMRNQENLLLSRLGLAQDARKIQLEGYKTGLDFITTDINLQQKIQDKLYQEEKDLLGRIDTLNTQQRQQFADILDVSKGLNPDNLSPEVQGQLAQLASTRGIPFDMVISGLKAIYNKDQADLLYKYAQINQINNKNSLLKDEFSRIKQIVAMNPREWGNAANQIDKEFGIGTATKYDSYLKSIYANVQPIINLFTKAQIADMQGGGLDVNDATNIYKAIQQGHSLDSIKEALKTDNKNPMLLDIFDRVNNIKKILGQKNEVGFK